MVNLLKSAVTASRDSRGGVRAGWGLQPSAAAKEVIVVPGHRAGPPLGPRSGQPRAGYRGPLVPGPDCFWGPQALTGRGQRVDQLPLSPQQLAQRYAHPTPETLLYSDCVGARPSWEASPQDEADDVIDLGAPRRVRRPREPLEQHPEPRRRTLLPNPRLYPGPKPKSKPKSKPKAQPRRAAAVEGGRSRRRKRALRPVPNSRLYRPGPPRPPVAPLPPARPRAAWPPPPPPARSLDTASNAALRLQQPRAVPPPPAPPARSSSPAPCEHRLVVTLPEAAARYRPASEHFRARAAPLLPESGESTPPAAACLPRPLSRASASMEAATADRHSATPEDRSDGNETLSAPSEFLAEFLSAIMRRQYAEALKYCRLILQYEPHNATARGFYPLLRHKVSRAARSDVDLAAAAEGGGSSGDEGAAGGSPKDSRTRQEVMEHSVESCGESDASEASAASEAGDHSSLELDSSDAQRSEPSLSLSRRTDRTDRTDRTHRTDDSASDVRWESSGSASRSGSDDAAEPDDNGNAPPAPCHRAPLLPDDLENDNATAAAGGEPAPHHTSHLKSDSLASLRRLRAQFACSIK